MAPSSRPSLLYWSIQRAELFFFSQYRKRPGRSSVRQRLIWKWSLPTPSINRTATDAPYLSLPIDLAVTPSPISRDAYQSSYSRCNPLKLRGKRPLIWQWRTRLILSKKTAKKLVAKIKSELYEAHQLFCTCAARTIASAARALPQSLI